jgi:hypothetical protein
MDIEKLLLARQNFWQKYPDRMTVEKTVTDTINSRSAGILTIGWQPEQAEQNKQIIQEVLIQSEKKRFFLLSLIEPAASADALAQPLLMDMIRRNFNIMEEPEVKRRWLQARKAAQGLLAKIDLNQINTILYKKRWYRIQVDAQDQGFRCVTEQLAEEGGAKKLKIKAVSYFESGPAMPAFTHLRGRSLGKQDGSNSPVEIPAVPTQIEELYSLDSNGGGEEFSFQVMEADNREKGFREKIIWKKGGLQISYFAQPQQAEPTITETLEMQEAIYLPFSLAQLLGRLVEKEPGGEYTFLNYSNHAICYYVLRIAAKEKLPVLRVKTGADGQEEKVTEEIPVFYLVSQVVPSGMVVETWLDEKGDIIKQRGGGIVILRSDEKTVESLWPKQVEQLQM